MRAAPRAVIHKPGELHDRQSRSPERPDARYSSPPTGRHDQQTPSSSRLAIQTYTDRTRSGRHPARDRALASRSRANRLWCSANTRDQRRVDGERRIQPPPGSARPRITRVRTSRADGERRRRTARRPSQTSMRARHLADYYIVMPQAGRAAHRHLRHRRRLAVRRRPRALLGSHQPRLQRHPRDHRVRRVGLRLPGRGAGHRRDDRRRAGARRRRHLGRGLPRRSEALFARRADRRHRRARSVERRRAARSASRTPAW